MIVHPGVCNVVLNAQCLVSIRLMILDFNGIHQNGQWRTTIVSCKRTLRLLREDINIIEMSIVTIMHPTCK